MPEEDHNSFELTQPRRVLLRRILALARPYRALLAGAIVMGMAMSVVVMIVLVVVIVLVACLLSRS